MARNRPLDGSPKRTPPVRYTLIDGEARSTEHPDTFEVPLWEVRASLRPGDLAKVGAEFNPDEPHLNVDSAVRPAFEEKFGQAWGERFWVLINDVRDGVYFGEVNNELGYTRHHGLYLGAPIRFEPRHVLAIWHGDDKRAERS
jgi:hypothetical protein